MIKNIEKSMINFQIKSLTDKNLTELQNFLNFFNDFFLLCEGVKGNAESMLKTCPPSKTLEKDKFVFGFYQDDILVGIIDLIQNYPENQIVTIGYLLISPIYQDKKIETETIQILSNFLKDSEFTKLKCVVQKQNPRALKFWQNSNFELQRNIDNIYTLEKNL